MIATDQLLVWLEHYKYAVLFPAVVVEGPVVTVVAGFLASLGVMNVVLVYAVVVVADVLADVMYYSIGRWGGMPLIRRWGHRFGATPERMAYVERHFERHPGKTLIVGKISHALVAPILVAAGIARMPLNRFVFYDIIATIPKSLVLVIIGFFFGQAYLSVRFNTYLNYAGVAAIGLAVLGILLYLGARKLIRAYTHEDV